MSASIKEASREVPVTGEYDVVVVGGGVAGCAAALAAVRAGASVALLEKSCSLGGLATLGIVNTYLPLCDGYGNQVIAGLGEELLKLANSDGFDTLPECWMPGGDAEVRKRQRYRIDFNPGSFLLALEALLIEEGVAIWYDTLFCDVYSSGRRVEALLVENKSGRVALRAKTIVDATGDADICARAGEETVSLRTNVACAWYFASNGSTLKRHVSSGRYAPDGGPGLGGEQGYAGDVAEQVTAQVLESRQMIRQQLAQLTARDKTPVLPIVLPTMATFRMTRRLEGEIALENAHAGVLFPDTIGLTGDWQQAAPAYAIPLRSLVARRTENLITAGRCISSASAWNVTRAIPTCVVTGQAAGVAAALAVRKVVPRLADLDIGELQEALRQQHVWIPANSLEEAYA